MRGPRAWTGLGTAAVLLLVGTSACGEDGEDSSDETSATTASGDGATGETAAPPAGVPPLSDASLTLTEIGQFDEPTAIVSRPGDDGSLFVTERGGRVRQVQVEGEGTDRRYEVADDPLVDISDEVETGYVEQGLLDIVFSPDGRRLYLHFSDASTEGGTHVISYDYDGAAVNPDSRREVLEVDQPYENHNGGEMAFGPDGYLYLALGDGGSGGDPDGNAQDLEVLLGKILRLNPEASANEGGEGYEVPEDNPFVDDEGARPEIWLYGARNPWRFSFDSETGDLWIGDVGQDSWEEIDWLPATDGRDAGRGANLGWNLVEGTHGFEGGENPDGGVLPVFEYGTHEDGACSVTGGAVYRGAANPNLDGAYLFGDYCSGAIRALRLVDGAVADQRDFDVEVTGLSSFGTDNDGELYVVSLEGPAFRLDP